MGQQPGNDALFGYVLRTTRRMAQATSAPTHQHHADPAPVEETLTSEPPAAPAEPTDPAAPVEHAPVEPAAPAEPVPAEPAAPVEPAAPTPVGDTPAPPEPLPAPPGPRSPEQLEADIAALISDQTPLGIAYSGGVDSATLLAVAVRVLGAENAVAILAVSPSLARREREAAHATAAAIGARVVEVETNEAADPNYRANGPDRCFFCKDEMFRRIDDALVDKLGLAAVAYGENADDAKRPDRPGSRAAVKHRVLRPLAEAGLTKRDVRALAHYLDVPVADKPAAPCLASRIPHGSEVTPQKLAQIDLAEDVLVAHGFKEGRVRHHGDIARIELPTAELPRAMDAGVRETLLAGVRAAGFRFVTIDLAGIQSGAFTAAAMGLEND